MTQPIAPIGQSPKSVIASLGNMVQHQGKHIQYEADRAAANSFAEYLRAKGKLSTQCSEGYAFCYRLNGAEFRFRFNDGYWTDGDDRKYVEGSVTIDAFGQNIEHARSEAEKATGIELKVALPKT